MTVESYSSANEILKYSSTDLRIFPRVCVRYVFIKKFSTEKCREILSRTAIRILVTQGVSPGTAIRDNE